MRRIIPGLIENILRRVEALSDNPFPRQAVKLSGTEETYRLRVGDYRVIYEVDPEAKAVVIYYIRHRREAYRRRQAARLWRTMALVAALRERLRF